jgi:hypothetical protein
MPLKSAIPAVRVAVTLLALAGAPAAAHHSIQATVDTSQRLSAEMVLTKVDWSVPPLPWGEGFEP